MTITNRTRKSGYRGLQPRTVDNIAKLRAALKADPGIGLEATAALLGWKYPTLLDNFKKIRHEYKKVWVHKDDHPEFWKQNP